MEGRGSAPPQPSPHSLRVDRSLERKESELPRAFAWASVHAVLSVGKVVCAFCERRCEHEFWPVYAAYGGIFIVLSILWGRKIDKIAPDTFDLIGGLVSLTGVFVIMYWPRA